jgi:thiopeptide-type bacteriocin biosynthesis protein
MVLDTYEPEMSRYGGPFGLLLAEKLFEADSDAALALVRSQLEGGTAQLGWRLALRGMDALLDDLGMNDAAKLMLARGVRQRFAAEFAADVALERELGARFRRLRAPLATLFDEAARPGPFADGIAALRARSTALAPIAGELALHLADGSVSSSLFGLADSYVHLFVNRIMRSSPRAQEYVLYDILERIYEGRAARARRAEAVNR